MTERRFFYAFLRNGRESFAIFHDEPPSKAMLFLAGGRVLFRQRLADDAPRRLDDLIARFRLEREYGRLRPDNMIPPPSTAAPTTLSHEIPKWKSAIAHLHPALPDGQRPSIYPTEPGPTPRIFPMPKPVARIARARQNRNTQK